MAGARSGQTRLEFWNVLDQWVCVCFRKALEFRGEPNPKSQLPVPGGPFSDNFAFFLTYVFKYSERHKFDEK